MAKLRLGIIGCGGMAMRSHSTACHILQDRLTVTAVCDIHGDRAEKAKEKFGAEFASTDYRDVLEHVDAVLVVLPHDLHYEVGMAALAAGKHVLMEKPLANTEQECLDLIALAEKQQKILMTAYPQPYLPMVARMKELVDNKTYGEVFQVSLFTEQYSKYPEGNWMTSAKRLGGGQLFSHGCHYIDQLLWMLGRPVKGTHLGTNYGTPWMEKEGTSNVTIEFESGALGMHFGTWGARGSRLGYSFHAHCTEGMIEMVANDNCWRLYAHTDAPLEHTGKRESRVELLMEQQDALKELALPELTHFLDCVRDNSEPLTDGPKSLQGLRVIWKLYEAEQENRFADLRGLGLDEDWRKAGA